MLGLALEPGVPETPPARWRARDEFLRVRRARGGEHEEHGTRCSRDAIDLADPARKTGYHRELSRSISRNFSDLLIPKELGISQPYH